MKNLVFKGLFAFSLLLNVAVAITLGWHAWYRSGLPPTVNDQARNPRSDDVHYMKNLWKGNGRADLMEARKKVQDKKLEVLDLIAKNPGNLEFADKNINELVMLRGNMERIALTRISKIMVDLPEDKRQEFLTFLKNRACGMPGMGHGRGRGRGLGPNAVEHCPVAPSGK